MMKFSALNESSLSDDDGDPELATREAQEEEAYSLYHEALQKQSKGELEESEEMLKEILDMEFLTQVKPNEEKEVSTPLRPALTLKYLLYKNLASISNAKQEFQSAVEYFLEALEIDNSDVMMWYQMGKASIKISNHSLARLCFEEGLKCNPNHWLCLDNLITVMYTLNDYANCLYFISKALERECYYLKGLAFKDQIYKEDPSLKSFCDGFFKSCDVSIYTPDYDKEEAERFIQESLNMRESERALRKPVIPPVLALTQPMKELTWKCLGESLVSMYDSVSNADSIPFSCKIDMSPCLEIGRSRDVPNDKSSLPSPVSSLSEACSSDSASRRTEGLLQLAPAVRESGENILHLEPKGVEMEIDEVPRTCDTPAPNIYAPLVLPQIDLTATDITLGNDSSGNRKMSKRKRLLTELSEFATKRRSSRMRNSGGKGRQDNINYQELLQKFLPPRLMGDGKLSEQDDDSDALSLDKTNSTQTNEQSSEIEKNGFKPTDLILFEREEVTSYIASNQANGGVIDLMHNYITILGRKSAFIWPKDLIDIYSAVFIRLRNHITAPNLFSSSTDIIRMKEISLGILLFCEFKVDKWYMSTGHSMSFSPKTSTNCGAQSAASRIGSDFQSDMEFLLMLTVRRDVLDTDWLDYTVRVLWLKAKFHSMEGEIDQAVCCMGKLSVVLEETNEEKPVKIIIHNCGFSNVVTSDKVQQQLESLQRCQSLEEVQRLYEQGDYTPVVNLLILSFNQPSTKRKQPLEGVPERHAQLLLLQNSLWKLERYRDCVIWSEVSFNEALQQFMNAARADWSDTMAKLLKGLENCAKLNANYLGALDESKLARLTQNLILVIVIQMENYDFSADDASLLVVLPWMILYRLILFEENRTKSKQVVDKAPKPVVEPGSAGNSSSKALTSSFLTDFDLSSSMPSSLMLLFTAHEYLGRRSWCTVADGFLLYYCIEVMMAELQDATGDSYLYREDLETGLEQCIYCLYGHPNKRARAKHLQEHNANQLTLTWAKSLVIFQYFKPNILPEFDSYRTSTISAELESLFKRISHLVPPDEDPTQRIDNYTAYIEGVTDKCPDPPFGNKKPGTIVKDMYYLLGDYYFKNKEFSKAIKYYLMDICINPDRQDSWAGMALSRSSQLDQKLNSYELRNESTVYRKSSAALKCFEHALELDPTTTSLWIEHGSLAYILHSHASRQLKQESVCDELFDMLKKKKMEMADVAEKCFRGANQCEDGGEPEEAWLHHYMLGKVCEKKGGRLATYLNHYQKALMYLHEDGARYPQKILYHNPADLAVEALEVYYRVHASCLKFLWKHESIGVDMQSIKIMRKCLYFIANTPFSKFQEKSKTDVSASSSEVDHTPTVPSPAFPQSDADHNYTTEDANTAPKKIDAARPSTDSTSESPDSAVVKEMVNSLVGAVTERIVDEDSVLQDKMVPIVSSIMVAEQTVYTSKEEAGEANIAGGNEKAKGEEKGLVFQEESEVKELTPLQVLAMERESEMAASILVEEMKLDDMDYTVYDEYGKEEQDVAFFEPESKEMDTKENPVVDGKNILCVDAEFAKEESIGNLVSKSMSHLIDEVERVLQEGDLKSMGNEQESSFPETRDDKKYQIDSVEKSESSMMVEGELMIAEDTDEVSENNEQSSVTSNVLKTPKENENASTINSSKKAETAVANLPSKDAEGVDASIDKLKETAARDTSKVEKMQSENKLQASIVNEKPKIATADKGSSKSNLARTDTAKDSLRLKKKKRIKKHPSPEELRSSKIEIQNLISVCLDALRECLSRFIQHYKSLYRMAHYYCHSTKNKNLQIAREILLAATPATQRYPAMPGLFAERKNTNFFNGIWRAPSNEIDRPGSFGSHMYRSIQLLIEVLTQQKDYNMLVNLTQQLYRTPELGRKYMRDTNREQLVRCAYDACVHILREQMNSLLQEEPPPEEKRLICCLLEIFRACQALVKAAIYVDETNDLLEEAYTMYKLGEVDSKPSVLEQATRFCQIQLGKSCPQGSVEFTKPGFVPKYMSSELGEGAFSGPFTQAYASEVWQKGKRSYT